MAERKARPETREQTTEEREHAAAARAVGQQLGPRKLGGTIIEADGRVTYTQDGAVSATPGGPPDPTIQPGQFEDEGRGRAEGRRPDGRRAPHRGHPGARQAEKK